MATVGLRELRQDASDLVRRVEGSEEIEITVAGRPAARLIPASPRRWQRWVDIAEPVRFGRPDRDWKRDRHLIDQSIGNHASASVKAVLDTSVLLATDVPPLRGRVRDQLRIAR